jgi:ribosomal protein S18 acetylase RimI-like enzyme
MQPERSPFTLAKARTTAEVAVAAALFREYADSLGVDLGFQSFEEELASLPGDYAPPGGELLLARSERGLALGCVGLRPLDDDGVCEMKRLYVRPEARGWGLGRALVTAVIAAAEERGYGEMKLDTLSFMTAAARLYSEHGFEEIASYYDNPIPGTRYFRLMLRPR